MKNYTIEVKLRISVPGGYGSENTIGECDIKKTALLPASKVKDEATKIVRNAVAHFSESSTLGLTPIMEEEPKLEVEEQNTLSV